MVDATTTASLPRSVASPTVDSSSGIGNVSVLMQAASSGDITTLELLMNSGFTTETRADDGSTALHCAARNGQAKTVQYLLRKGANCDVNNHSYRKPLHEGFLGGDLDTVKVLIEHMPEGHMRWRDLHYLARVKNIEVFRFYAQHSKTSFGAESANKLFRNALPAKNDALAAALIERQDIDVNGYVTGHVPILDAARYGNAKAMELLLASDRVDKRRITTYYGSNALHLASSHGHADIVEQLLRLNFDVESLDTSQRNPLQLAARGGHLGIIKLLVNEWGANLSHSDRYGLTPLHHAAFKAHWECAHVLLEYIDSKSHEDAVGMKVANTEFVTKDVVTRLLDSAAFNNPNLPYSRSGSTLLHRVAYKGDLEAIEVLLTHDEIDVNATDDWRRSPLLTAVDKHQIEAVRLLLQHPQIDVNQKCRWGSTALSRARGSRHQEIVDLLLSHGAVDDRARNASTKTTEASSSPTTVKAGHIYNTLLQPQQKFGPEFDFGIFMEGLPALDVEDEMMRQEFY